MRHATLSGSERSALTAALRMVCSCAYARGPYAVRGLIEAYLDLDPAESPIELEHRLHTLAAALRRHPAWASNDDILASAVRLSSLLN